LQALVGSLACVLVLLAGRRVFDRRTGLIAGLLLAGYAPAIFFDLLVQKTVLDAGLKASSVDSGLPVVWNREGLRYARASDEHGVLEIAPGARAPALGEKLLLVPGHCDPTANLYDWYVCVRGGVVEDLWPISARGALY